MANGKCNSISTGKFRTIDWHIWLICVTLVLLTLGLVSRSVWLSRERAFDDYQRNTGIVGFLLTEQTSRYIRTIDLVLQAIETDVQTSEVEPLGTVDGRNAADAHLDLVRLVRNIPGSNALLVFDADGRLKNSSRPGVIPSINAADRGYFTCSGANEKSDLCVDVKTSRVVGAWTLFFARRLHAADGKFMGVAAAAIAVDELHSLYHSILMDSQTTITLSRTDGLILVQYPDNPVASLVQARSENKQLSLPWYDVLSRIGEAHFLSGEPGRTSLVTVRKVAGYPFAITIATPQSEVLAAWRGETIKASVAALVVIVSLITLFWVLSRHISKRNQAEAALCASQELLEGILNAMPVRVFWKNRNLTYLGCNLTFAHDAGFTSPLDVIGSQTTRWDGVTRRSCTELTICGLSRLASRSS